jgi:long-chain acyl-CoA synthetase
MSSTNAVQSENGTTTHQLVYSTIVPNTDRLDRGVIHRGWDPLVSPVLGHHGCQTLYESIRRGATLNPYGPCLGFRAISTTGFATPYIFSTYTECISRIDALAAGIETLDLLGPPLVSPNGAFRTVALYMKNCVEWVLTEHATFCLGGTTVPLYDTLGTGTVEYILAQTQCRTVFCSRLELPKLCRVKENSNCPQFATAIIVDGITPQASQDAAQVGLILHSYAKVEAVGSQRIATQGHKHTPPSPSDIATFCYTSGTTGNPKGALLSHQNFISSAAGYAAVAPEMVFQPIDRHLSYLPLAHIFERVVQVQLLAVGASIAFFRGDPTMLIDDLQACRPTFLPVAPRVLNKIHDKIMSGFAATGGIKQKLFEVAVKTKLRNLKEKGQLTHAVYDRLLFSKIKKGLGMDHIRVMASGSAPLAENVMFFFRILLGVPVLEGYGQTEGTSAATLSHPSDQASAGHVGCPTGACEIALFDVPEMGYLHGDTLHLDYLACLGRGEICIRGPNVFRGYFNDSESSRETVDSEGWLHSGDIGLWRLDGTLQIIDRKKNLFKLSQGEYVAPEKIENILSRSALIAQIFVYGDSLKNDLVAIVVPDDDAVRNWAIRHNIASIENDIARSLTSWCESNDLRKAILSEIMKLSNAAQLHGFEIVKAIHLTSELFSVENDLLTPTFKLKRQQTREKYDLEIKKLYNSLITSSKL